MSIFPRFVVFSALVFVLAAASYAAWWIVAAKAAPHEIKKPSPAADLKKVNEGELGTITLTEEADDRLGIKTAPVERKTISRVRIYGGEALVPPGRTILVSAPLQGTLQAPASGALQAGQRVEKGQHVLSLLPLFSPEASTTLATSRADVEGQTKNAQTQLAAMKLALDRAQRLFREEAGSKRLVEEAQVQHDLALRSVEAAEARLAILTKAIGNVATGRAEPIQIESPENGILRNVSALPEQNVPGGGALFEVIDMSEMWVRVPIYVGDMSEIATAETAQVGPLRMLPNDPIWLAKPVQAPPSANALSSTLDLYFSLSNDKANLTPGQRVGVKLLLNSSGESLTAPWSAVVHDLQGGSWVYESLGARKFCRRRVHMKYAVDGTAVLSAGPPPGTQVVVEGAIELFGAETGFSK